MRYARFVALLTCCGCNLVIDTDQLTVELELEVGSFRDTHRLYPQSLIEGRGASPGSPPNLVMIRNAGIRASDRLAFEGSGNPVDCQPPSTDSCNAAGDDSSCCIGPFVGSNPDLAAVLVRIGVHIDEPDEEVNPEPVDIVLVRDGEIRAGAATTLISLPERTIAAGTYTLDELYDYRPDGDEPFALYSRIEIDDAIEIVPGGELDGPARFVASNRISIGPNASILSRLAGGSAQAATSPELLGTEIGAMGFFADELSLAENDDDFLPHFNADAIVFRGSVVDIERPYFSRCTSFSQLYPPLSPIPTSDCDFDRSIRFDVGRLCVQNDPDGISSGVDACESSPAVVEVADSMRGLSVGPRLRVADGRYVVTGDTLASFALLLEGAGVYSISNDNSDGGQVISELSVGSVPGRYPPGEPRPDVGDFVDEVVVDAIDLSEGKNIVCAWPADGTDRIVRADVPEMGTCIEIIFLP